MSPDIVYLPDREVDTSTDLAIRRLLTLCFRGEGDDVFKQRRYWKEPYPNRFVIRGPADNLIAHVGVHEKEVRSGDTRYRFGGIAEVCVHPDYRSRGYVRSMLNVIHPWLAERGFVFSILFGNPEYYSSSGYEKITNLTMDDNPLQPGGKRHPATDVMVHALGPTPWPKAEVYLPGLHF
jgi:predicted N-acetyltransferase YhbS